MGKNGRETQLEVLVLSRRSSCDLGIIFEPFSNVGQCLSESIVRFSLTLCKAHLSECLLGARILLMKANGHQAVAGYTIGTPSRELTGEEGSRED